MNIERMLRVAKQIEMSETYDQGLYMHESGDPDVCGTPACVAGHAAFMSLSPTERFHHFDCEIMEDGEGVGDIPGRAETWLGIEDLGDARLFTGAPHENWPAPFSRQWYDTLDMLSQDDQRKAQASIAAAYIRYLVQEDINAV